MMWASSWTWLAWEPLLQRQPQPLLSWYAPLLLPPRFPLLPRLLAPCLIPSRPLPPHRSLSLPPLSPAVAEARAAGRTPQACLLLRKRAGGRPCLAPALTAAAPGPLLLLSLLLLLPLLLLSARVRVLEPPLLAPPQRRSSPRSWALV